MPKLFYAPASPYSAKVRMAASLVGIAIEPILVDTSADPSDLLRANPLGKIPTLVEDDGTAVFDSRVIMQHLDKVSGGKLFPRGAAKRLEAMKLEALADGITDCLLAHVYERRSRPEEKVHQPWVDKQWRKVERALDVLLADLPGLPARLQAGHLALRAATGYLALRFPGTWEKGRKRLVNWTARFDAKFPELAKLAPK